MISKKRKAIRHQAGVHGDPLRNHRAEAEEARHWESMILLGKTRACSENMWFRLEKLRFRIEKLSRSSKKAGKTCVLGDFATKNAKSMWFFDEKRFQRNPKAVRNQVGGHWDPLRNHRAEAEEARHWETMILLGKTKAFGENMWFRLEKSRFRMEKLRRSSKKAGKNITFW